MKGIGARHGRPSEDADHGGSRAEDKIALHGGRGQAARRPRRKSIAYVIEIVT